MAASQARTVLAIALLSLAAAAGCSKKKDDASAGGGGGGGAAASGLPWTPEGYAAMSATCKKALACCEEVAKSEGAKSAGDFNGKCSGPAMWKDPECEMDLKSRVAMFESATKPVPDACK